MKVEIEYKNFRKNIITGDLFFTASTAFFSRLIRLFTQSKISHVGVFLWLGERLFIVEALEGKGVQMTLASERIKKDVCWWGRTTRKTKDIHQIEDFLLSSIGTDYDMKGALLSLIYDTKSSNNFCSELASKALGIKLPFLNRGIIPLDIVNICDKVEKFKS